MVYLIYSCFSTANSVSGSVLLATATTEADALAKVELYKKRAADCHQKFPNGLTRHIYINWPHPL